MLPTEKTFQLLSEASQHPHGRGYLRVNSASIALWELRPKKRPLHNSLSRRGFRGRGDRIRTYDLLTPSQTLCQAELRPVKFVAGSRESRCPMRPEDHTAAGQPRKQATKRKYTVSSGYTKRFLGPFKHSSAACLLQRHPHAIISLCRTISPPYANPVSSCCWPCWPTQQLNLMRPGERRPLSMFQKQPASTCAT